MKGRQVLDIEAMKSAVGFDPDAPAGSRPFSAKWAEALDSETLELIDLWVEGLVQEGKSKKAAASYKSLVTRFVATGGTLSEGKSGESMKSAVRSYIRFLEAFSDEDGEEDETED
jgi:hypothetical protein